MNIGIDFDDTITALPEVFRKFIEDTREAGNDIRIVTCRGEEFGVDEVFEYANTFEPKVPVIYTSGCKKAPYCEKYHDFKVDIWIDDNPHWCGTENKDEWEVGEVDSLEYPRTREVALGLTENRKVYWSQRDLHILRDGYYPDTGTLIHFVHEKGYNGHIIDNAVIYSL